MRLITVCDTSREELIVVLGCGSNIGPHGPPYSIGPCVRRTQLIYYIAGIVQLLVCIIPEDEVEGLIREIPLEKQVIRTVVVFRLYSLSF